MPPNDLVTTSGEDRAAYPPSIPIGNVTAATVSSDQLRQIVTVEPLADLSNVTLVKVLALAAGAMRARSTRPS